MEHRITGHKALILATVMGEVQDIEAQIRDLQQAHAALSSALHAEAEAVVGHDLPSPMGFNLAGDEVVLSWDGDDLPV